MNIRKLLSSFALLFGAAVISPFVSAGPGHDHGEEAAKATGGASPRLEAHSDTFELVGVLENKGLTVFLDRYASNEPVVDAQIEFETGQTKGIAKAKVDGTYRIEIAELKDPHGTLPFSFTIKAGNDMDLLAADLVNPEAKPGHTHGAKGADTIPSKEQTRIGQIVAGVVGVLVALFVGFKLLRRRARRLACIVTPAALVVSFAADPSNAGPGHDHGDEKPSAASNGPQRLPDGSVFLPKTSQRQLNIRTTPAEVQSIKRSIELNGKVIADPAYSGKVQAAQAGRLEPGSPGQRMLSVGDSVSAGQILAIVRPSIGALERANQAAQIAEANTALDLAKRKLARLEQLEGTVPQRDIDAARNDVKSLTERGKSIGGSLSTTEVLKSPVSGIVAAVNATAGQVVDAREPIYEIVNPNQLRIEALAFDPAIASKIQSAVAQVGKENVPLSFKGSPRALRDGAMPLLFAIQGKSTQFVVGQPVTLFIETNAAVQGIVLPTQALVKNPNNLPVVWKHDVAERFVPLTVTIETLDASRIVVLTGIEKGTRVVTQGASFVNQVR